MGVYGPWLADAIGASVAGNVKAMLMTDAFVMNEGAHYRAELSNEATGTGYATGGVPVANVTVVHDGATASVKLSCDPVDFGVVTIPLVGAVVFYLDSGSATTDVVIAADVFTPVELGGTDAIYTPDPAGVVLVTTA